jgi:hypothetical protein
LGLVALAQGDDEPAEVLLRESLELRRAQGDALGIAESLEGLASVARFRRQNERAARLFGAAEALRQAVNVPRWPIDQPGYERDVANLKALLGEEAFDIAWAGGQSMAIEEAAEFALSPGF